MNFLPPSILTPILTFIAGFAIGIFMDEGVWFFVGLSMLAVAGVGWWIVNNKTPPAP